MIKTDNCIVAAIPKLLRLNHRCLPPGAPLGCPREVHAACILFSFQDLLGGWVKIHFLQQLKGGRVEIVKIVNIVNVGAVYCELS